MILLFKNFKVIFRVKHCLADFCSHDIKSENNAVVFIKTIITKMVEFPQGSEILQEDLASFRTLVTMSRSSLIQEEALF